MSFNNTKSKLQAERGFTIVELLIVIVVIGILAAITIVSYTGITARANLNAAKGNAATFAKKAELYYNDSSNGRYPVTDTELTGAAATASYFLADGITANYSTTALTSSAGSNTIRVLKCYTGTAMGSGNTQANIVASSPTVSQRVISGLKVIWWDATTNAETTSPSLSGDTTNCPDA